MRVILFILALLAIGAAALLYYPVSDDGIRQSLDQGSLRLQKQATEARKSASLAIKDINKRLEGLKGEYRRLRDQANQGTAESMAGVTKSTDKTRESAKALQEKIIKLSKEARETLDAQAMELHEKVKQLKEEVERELATNNP